MFPQKKKKKILFLHAMQKKMVEFLGEKYGKKKNLNKI
jgi:hypothetical protein